MNLLSIKQAADKLDKSRQYVWLLIKMGLLRARKVGGRYVVTQSQLDKYISKKQNTEAKASDLINSINNKSKEN
jgi:excisionase family DNA binding protein